MISRGAVCLLFTVTLLSPCRTDTAVRSARRSSTASNGQTSHSCWSEFDDVASKTVLADVVFQGRAVRTIVSTENPSRTDVIFTVTRRFKGDLEQEDDRKQYRPVVVGPFSTNSDASEEGCFAPAVRTNSNYIVFASAASRNHSVGGASAGGMSVSSTHYRLSSPTTAASRRNVKHVRDHSCRNCGESPSVNLHPRRPAMAVKTNKRLRLECRGQGKPKPVYVWFKDDVELRSSKQRRIRKTKRGSRLQVGKAKEPDSGTYKCQARNALGVSNVSKSIEVTVISGENASDSKEHSELCASQDYCLNGGTCFMFVSLRSKFCECPSTYQGRRCEQKKVDVTPAESRPLYTGKVDLMTKYVLVIVGSAIIFTTSLAICITICCIVKMKYRELAKKQDNKGLITGDSAANTSSSSQPAKPESQPSIYTEADVGNTSLPATMQSEGDGQQQAVPLLVETNDIKNHNNNRNSTDDAEIEQQQCTVANEHERRSRTSDQHVC